MFLCSVVEWYCNGKPIQHGHRFKTTYDFGFVALDILYAHAEDTGTYMCKAKNAVGEAVTTCSVSAAGIIIYYDYVYLNLIAYFLSYLNVIFS